jgi:hypothetical protein
VYGERSPSRMDSQKVTALRKRWLRDREAATHLIMLRIIKCFQCLGLDKRNIIGELLAKDSDLFTGRLMQLAQLHTT